LSADALDFLNDLWYNRSATTRSEPMNEIVSPTVLWDAITARLPKSGKFAFAVYEGWIFEQMIADDGYLRVGVTCTSKREHGIVPFPPGTWQDHYKVAQAWGPPLIKNAIRLAMGEGSEELNAREVTQVEDIFNMKIQPEQVTCVSTGFSVGIDMGEGMFLRVTRDRCRPYWNVSTGNHSYHAGDDLAEVYRECQEGVRLFAKRVEILKEWFDV